MIKTPDGATSNAPASKSVRLAVEKSGPIRAIVRMEGLHRSAAGRSLFNYSARFIFHAGAPWSEAEYSFTNKEDAESTVISRL